MWGRDPLAIALGVETVKAESEAQAIARAMFAGIVPAGITQIRHCTEARVEVLVMVDQAGNVMTPEARAERYKNRRPYNPNDFYRNYQDELPPDAPHTVYGANDHLVPAMPRICRTLEAAIEGVDFTEHPREAPVKERPAAVKSQPVTQKAPQFGGVLGLSGPPKDPTDG